MPLSTHPSPQHPLLPAQGHRPENQHSSSQLPTASLSLSPSFYQLFSLQIELMPSGLTLRPAWNTNEISSSTSRWNGTVSLRCRKYPQLWSPASISNLAVISEVSFFPCHQGGETDGLKNNDEDNQDSDDETRTSAHDTGSNYVPVSENNIRTYLLSGTIQPVRGDALYK